MSITSRDLWVGSYDGLESFMEKISFNEQDETNSTMDTSTNISADGSEDEMSVSNQTGNTIQSKLSSLKVSIVDAPNADWRVPRFFHGVECDTLHLNVRHH